MFCYNCMHDKGDAAVCPYCGVNFVPDPLPHHLVPGTVVGGRYIIGRVLGEGGFGITYIALDKKLDMPVAVKEFFFHGYSQRNTNTSEVIPISIRNSKEDFEGGKQRFLAEAKTIARFSNEQGIVNVTDFFEDNNTAYIVMEYLQGVDMREFLRRNGVMRPQDALNMLLPVMRSLSKVHQAGLIHRDISPDNIMVLQDGRVKLMDFGAARDYADENRSLSVMLKLGFAPEEQYRRRGQQGPWTDVYAMAATLYCCITGFPPTESIERIREDDLKKPSDLGVAISPEMENAILYGLAVNKDNRCPDMMTLIDCLTGKRQVQVAVQPEPPADEYRTVVADMPTTGEDPRYYTPQQASPLQAAPEIKMAPSRPAVNDPNKTIPASDIAASAPANPQPAVGAASLNRTPVQKKGSSDFRNNLAIVLACVAGAAIIGGLRLFETYHPYHTTWNVPEFLIPCIPVVVAVLVFFIIKLAPNLIAIGYAATGVFAVAAVFFGLVFAGAINIGSVNIGSMNITLEDNAALLLMLMSIGGVIANGAAVFLQKWLAKAG